MDDTATARKRQRLEDELRKAQERVDQIKEELAKFSVMLEEAVVRSAP